MVSEDEVVSEEVRANRDGSHQYFFIFVNSVVVVVSGGRFLSFS